jgi:RNA polymerase sigma-70 factor (ECF subfamily)
MAMRLPRELDTQSTRVGRAADLQNADDAELVDLARSGDGAAFDAIMKRYDRRLYRVARAIVRNDSEAEDVLQDAYMHAFTRLSSFQGKASLATWLTRITLNKACGSLRRRRPAVELKVLDSITDQGVSRIVLLPTARAEANPEAAAARAEVRRVLERAIDELPEAFRLVFILRDVEGMSIEETASALGIRPETVKTRLHRARRRLREALGETLSSAVTDAFPFEGARCDELRQTVLTRLGLSAPQEGTHKQ